MRPSITARDDGGEPGTAVPLGVPDLGLRTAKRAVFETLRDMIVNFELAPGDRLVETGRGAAGVSKTPVREALFLLERDGLTDSAPHRGATVRWLSVIEMVEQGFLVDALEMPAYPIVVSNATDEELAEVGRLTETQGRTSEPGRTAVHGACP